jgi:hypothetical protein
METAEPAPQHAARHGQSTRPFQGRAVRRNEPGDGQFDASTAAIAARARALTA